MDDTGPGTPDPSSDATQSDADQSDTIKSDGSGPSFLPDIDASAFSGVPHLTRPSFAISPQLMENAGKYARGAVLFAFEEVGGAPALAQWAQDNPAEFYTKLFPKIITKEAEVSGPGGGPLEVVIRDMTKTIEG